MPRKDDEGPNTRATWGAAAVVVVLLALGVWVFGRLDASQKAQACVESGGRKCAIIEAPAR